MTKNQLSLYLFVSVLFVVGVIFGALMVNALTLEQQQELAKDVEQYVQQMSGSDGNGETELFWERFAFHGKWLVMLWVLGVTVVGVPGVLAMNFLKGSLVGFSIGLLINQYAWKGVLFSLVTIAPQNVIIVPAMIMLSAAALSFSIYVIKDRLLQQKGELRQQLVSFTSTAVLIFLIFTGAALFEAFVSPMLIGWVSPILSSFNATI